MRKNQVRNIIVHTVNRTDSHALADRVSQFHVDVIERRLQQSGLSAKHQVKVVDNIIANLKLQGVGGIIK